jgi:hypothetical protein
MIRSSTRQIRIPAARPSDSEGVRHENCIELKTEFSSQSHYADDYRAILSKAKSDRLLELIVSADSFFNSSREFGLEVIKYCEDIRKRFSDEFKIKNADEGPDINNDEYAHYELLAVFVVERQLGIIKDGLSPFQGPEINGERYFSLNLNSNGKLWYGPESKLELRRIFIDKMLLDSKRSDHFKTVLAKLKDDAAKLNLQFGLEINRLKQMIENQEKENKSTDTKVDVFIRRIKNNTLIAIVIVAAVAIMAVIGFATTIEKVIPWFSSTALDMKDSKVP